MSSTKYYYDDGGAVAYNSQPAYDASLGQTVTAPSLAPASSMYAPSTIDNSAYLSNLSNPADDAYLNAPIDTSYATKLNASGSPVGSAGGLASGLNGILKSLGLNNGQNLSALALLAQLGAAATGPHGGAAGTSGGQSFKPLVPAVNGQGTSGGNSTGGQGYGPGGKGYAFVNYLTTPQAPKTNLPQSAYYTYGSGPEHNFGVSSPGGMAHGGAVRHYDVGGAVPAQPTPMGGMLSGQPMNGTAPPGQPGQTPAPSPGAPAGQPPMTPQQPQLAQTGAPSAGRPASPPPPPNGVNSVTGMPRIGTPLRPATPQPAPAAPVAMPPQAPTGASPPGMPHATTPMHPYGAPMGPYGGAQPHMARGGGVDPYASQEPSADPYGAPMTPGISRHIKGAGDGTSDDIPAKLARGEYVLDSQAVSMLGNGDNDAGAKKLDQFRKNLRAHKGKPLAKGRMAPDAKAIEAYMPKGGK